MVINQESAVPRFLLFLSVFFIIIPIHITFDQNFNIYYNRESNWYHHLDQSYVSIPLGTFWLCLGFLYLLLIRPMLIVIPTLTIMIYLGTLFFFDVYNFRFLSNAAGFLYFFLCVELLKLSAKYFKFSELNGWSVYAIWSLLVLVVEFFPQLFFFNVYGFEQYVSTLMASLVIGFFFLKNSSILGRIVLSMIFYISAQYALESAESTYVYGSLALAVFFYGMYFFLKSLKFEAQLIFNILFWSINLLYLIFLFSSYDFTFKNSREYLAEGFFENPISLIIPFVKNEMTYFYSSHSFLIESFRTFGVLSFFVLFFMLKAIIRTSNLSGTMIALHAFVLIGLFSMPQLHFYTIPLIVLLPYLNWSTLPFFGRR